MITGAHSKSSNSSGFNPILQKFYKMICKIVVSKTVRKIFLIFCLSSFINNFMLKNSFLESTNRRKLNISRPVYFFKKKSAHCFVGLICTNKLEGLKKLVGAFITTATRLIWASFFPQKNNFYTFF